MPTHSDAGSEEGGGTTIDRRAINVLLAALDVEQRDVAARMGYQPGYVANVFNGCSPSSDAFKKAFGEVVAELVLGNSNKAARSYPAGPLRALIERRAGEAVSRMDFYADLGVSCYGWNKRERVSAALIDRVCCAVGVHPSAIYPEFMEEAR
ncbi:MAG: hypothetical protein ACRDJ5_01580 [Actinomycetota bacterium]